MIDSENAAGLNPVEQLAQMAALGIEATQNLGTAGRMPPGSITPLFPYGIYNENTPGFIFERLKNQLPSPTYDMRSAFNGAAAGPDSRSRGFNNLLNPKSP
jgi:hypothetical protein